MHSFAAVLIGRQHILNAGGPVPGAPFDPSIRDCQQALHRNASQLADAIQEHINELHVIRDKHHEIWPSNLDLNHLQAYLNEGRQTLDFYKDQLEARGDALPAESSIALLAQRREQGIEMIEVERANLAVAVLARAGLKNSGLS